jgi:uncharacterized protein YeaO (DUF488 family)
MTLVYTARKWLRDPDMLDVTRAGGGPSVIFAPSWELLKLAKSGAVSFPRYTELYTAEMRVCYGVPPEHPRAGPDEHLAWSRGVRPRREAWEELLGRERVVLGCYEVDASACHRSVLAGILVRLGAVYKGEIPMPVRQKRSA